MGHREGRAEEVSHRKVESQKCHSDRESWRLAKRNDATLSRQRCLLFLCTSLNSLPIDDNPTHLRPTIVLFSFFFFLLISALPYHFTQRRVKNDIVYVGSTVLGGRACVTFTSLSLGDLDDGQVWVYCKVEQRTARSFAAMAAC